MPWSAEAFERARSEDKPVLLSISAVWCHWCHVMDETSYSDAAVIDAINREFVPIRVDNDRRPDINARYNMGGWPTTAFLAPDGSTLTGATYLPPEQMRRALDEIAEFYRQHKTEIEQRAQQSRERRASPKAGSRDELRESMVIRLVEEIADGYDEEFGGFGTAPKFPQPDVLEFLLSEWRLSGDHRLYEMVAKSMIGMSHGGMYDHVEGGFFRYSTTRDWSVPHFEKMAEDHAGLIRVLAQLVLVSENKEFRATLRSAKEYVRTVLRDPRGGLYAGSQDADEEYFALPLDERRQREAPYVDRTSYSNWTCALAGSLLLAGRALDDDELVRENLATLDYVAEVLPDDEGLLYHVLAPGDAPSIRGLLADQVAYLRALVDAHEISGAQRFLERARDLADRVRSRFESEDGGFYDRIPLERPIGRLEISDRPIGDNGTLADTLLRLAVLTNTDNYRRSAERALALYARSYGSAGAFASTYGRAVRRFLSAEVAVRIVGAPESTDAFREVAFRLPTPLTVIRTVEPAAAETLDLPAEPEPAAYLCSGSACAAPATGPERVRAAYDSLLRLETPAPVPRT